MLSRIITMLHGALQLLPLLRPLFFLHYKQRNCEDHYCENNNLKLLDYLNDIHVKKSILYFFRPIFNQLRVYNDFVKIQFCIHIV